jgi:CzcA family heavy metal efflux pump
MAPLGFAYLVSLGASLLVALLITPVMSYSLLSGQLTAEEDEPRFNVWLKSRYRHLLDKTIHYWQALLIFSMGLLLLSLFALSQAGKAFLPDFNEGTLTISMATLPGTSLTTSDALAKQVDDILLAQPEVVSFARRTGRAESDPHAMDVSASEIEVTLALQGRDKAELLQRLRQAFAGIPGSQIVIGQPISHRIDHMLSGSRANIAIKIFGPDLSELRRLTQDIKAIAQATSGAVDVTDEQQINIPFLSVRFHRQALAQYGFTIADVSQAIETAFYGREVNRIQEGQASYALWLTMPASTRASIEAVRTMLITSPTGAQVPLSTLASVDYDRAPYSISREQVQRKMVVMANVSGRDLASVVTDIQQQVAARVSLPTGYRIEYGGQFEQAEAATQQLLLLGLVVIVGVFVLLVLALGSITLASLVMLNLPLALIGGVLGVYLGDGILSVASLIGFITLFGIATRNGVMMISHIQHLQAVEGVTDRLEAVIRGAQERLLPILMTALSAALALIPLSLAAGQPGSEIQAPMALVILWGLLSATALTLWVLPAMVVRFGR